MKTFYISQTLRPGSHIFQTRRKKVKTAMLVEMKHSINDVLKGLKYKYCLSLKPFPHILSIA